MKLPGISFNETLSGHYWRLDAPVDERAIALALTLAIDEPTALVRDGAVRLSGTIDAENFATAQKLEGHIYFKLFDERRLPYRCTFRGDDGGRYELAGEKEFRAFAPIESFTLLSASVFDDRGDEIARATLRFDLRAEWREWLRGVRVFLAPG